MNTVSVSPTLAKRGGATPQLKQETVHRRAGEHKSRMIFERKGDKMCRSIWQPFHFKYGEIKILKDLYPKVKKKKNKKTLKFPILSSVFLSFTYNIINAYLTCRIISVH